MKNKFHRSAGFSLLEVLVALVVLSIGLIGVAAVQVSSLKFTQTSQQRSMASNQLASMTERMRSNLSGVRQGFYAFSFPYASIPGAVPAAVSASVPHPCSGQCSPATLAQQDLRDWLVELNRALPNGRAVITGDAANSWRITIMWEEKDLTAGLKSTCLPALAAPAEAQCLSANFQP